jgi:hypothetical protein
MKKFRSLIRKNAGKVFIGAAAIGIGAGLGYMRKRMTASAGH